MSTPFLFPNVSHGMKCLLESSRYHLSSSSNGKWNALFRYFLTQYLSRILSFHSRVCELREMIASWEEEKHQTRIVSKEKNSSFREDDDNDQESTSSPSSRQRGRAGITSHFPYIWCVPLFVCWWLWCCTLIKSKENSNIIELGVSLFATGVSGMRSLAFFLNQTHHFQPLKWEMQKFSPVPWVLVDIVLEGSPEPASFLAVR